MAVSSAETTPNGTMAIMMPTAIRVTPTANRSRKADEKQNFPYCRHIPYTNPKQR